MVFGGHHELLVSFGGEHPPNFMFWEYEVCSYC